MTNSTQGSEAQTKWNGSGDVCQECGYVSDRESERRLHASIHAFWNHRTDVQPDTYSKDYSRMAVQVREALEALEGLPKRMRSTQASVYNRACYDLGVAQGTLTFLAGHLDAEALRWLDSVKGGDTTVKYAPTA